jgi:hypothetical protein
LGDGVSAFEQDRPELVHQRASRADEALADPVQRLHVEPLRRLQLDEAHGRPRRGFRDRLGIPVVVLSRLHVRADVFRRHEPDLVAPVRQDPSQQVGAAACLHGDGAGLEARGEIDRRPPPHPTTQHDGALLIQSHDAADVLSEVDPKHGDGHGFLPFSRAHVIVSAAAVEGRAIP